MNSVNLIGRLTGEPEIRTTTNGVKVCSFRIAVDAGKDKAYFFSCVAWRERGENIAKYFHKGDKIGISGCLTQRTYEADGKNVNVIEIMVDSFDFCNGRKENKTDNEESSGEVPFEL